MVLNIRSDYKYRLFRVVKGRNVNPSIVERKFMGIVKSGGERLAHERDGVI